MGHVCRPPPELRSRAGRLAAVLQVWLCVIWACTAPLQAQDRRVALVIGNATYAQVPDLVNPANDAADLRDALVRLGFRVTFGTNLDDSGMRRALRDFGETAADADIALIYYAGHGIEIDGTNYLIPVNASLRSDRDVEFETVRLDAVVGALDASRGLKIVLVDACRNNPFAAEMTRSVATRSIGRGLSRIDPGGVLVGYSARGGTIALDGEGRNSPYAAALLRHIEEPGLEIGKLFRLVRDSVLETTRGAQEPFTYGSLPGSDIFLIPPVTLAAAAEPAVPEGPRPVPLDEQRFEAAKRLGTPRAWALFFRLHPEGRFTRAALEEEEKALGRVIEAFAMADDRRGGTGAPRDPAYDPRQVTPDPAANADPRLGVGSAEVFAVQSLLKRLGFYDGPIDGRLGTGSRASLRAFQTARGLPPHGIVTRATLVSLGLPAAVEGEALRPAISSTVASPQWERALASLEEDPRMVQAAKRFLGHRQVTYGFRGGRLYVAVRSDWVSTFRSLEELVAQTGGHLATITSKEENDFIVELIRYDSGFWGVYRKEWISGPTIGLRQRPGSAEPRGGWEWVTGEPMSYVNWSLDMPNNNEGKAAVGAFGHHHPEGSRQSRRNWGKWDDYVKPTGAYIIEIP
ncbi:MAG TPA: caspase family protein [Paracoccaceae bacterium]|nr:caspase family protein [Paracoccaceae bacterium]